MDHNELKASGPNPIESVLRDSTTIGNLRALHEHEQDTGSPIMAISSNVDMIKRSDLSLDQQLQEDADDEDEDDENDENENENKAEDEVSDKDEEDDDEDEDNHYINRDFEPDFENANEARNFAYSYHI